MKNKRSFLIPFILFSLLSMNQAELLHKRDTLHILKSFGREVSFSKSELFMVDSINPGIGNYACSLSHKGAFFASLGRFPTCPCCPTWTIGSPRPFYRSVSSKINLSAKLNLQDSTRFTKVDTSGKSYGRCELPSTGDLSVYIFSNTEGFAKMTYLLVNVMKAFTDPKKPTISAGGDMGYPVTTCTNMLIVDMWLQTDGTTSFQGVQLTSIYNNTKMQPESAPVSLTELPHRQVYDLKGRCMSFSTKRKLSDIPQGCYFLKEGPHLNRLVSITK